MSKKWVLLFLLVSFSETAKTQSIPDWINPLMREQKYPSNDYYVGFVSQSYQKNETLDSKADKLKGAARAALSESIFVSIKSESLSEMNNTNGVSEDRYQKSTVTSSSLEAIGMKTEVYTDSKKRIVYAFTYVKKKSLISHYYRLLSSEIVRIETSLKRTEKIEDNTEAYKRYIGELSALTAVKEYQDMLKYLEVSSEFVLMTAKWEKLYGTVLDEIDSLRNNENIGIKEASYFLVDKLKEELNDETVTIHMGLITYKNSGIPTEFSDYFGHLFRQALEEKRGGISRSINKDGYVVSGSYWPGEEEIQIIANINYVKDGENVNLKAGGSIAVDLEKVKRLGIDYDLSAKNELLEKNSQLNPTSPVGGLVANLTTQKGSQSVIFKEGELLNLSVSVSQPSYIRVINILSDNKKFLLVDNLFIASELTNQSIRLPGPWETDCPCGVEYIQLVAQDQPFEPLQTEDEDGFQVIKGTLNSVLTKSRSIKSSSEYYAESTLVVTTME